MSYDLRRGLDALAAEERAAAGDLPVDALRTRAHRRRTVRTAAASGLAVAVVAAVAVAAVALPDRLRTPPAGTPTPTDTTPTPTPEAWPSAVTLDGPVPGCGDPMPALVRPAGDPEIALEVEVGLPPVQGGVVDTGVTIVSPPGFQVAYRSSDVVGLLVRDGVVVAVPDPLDEDVVYWSDEGEMGALARQPRAERCAEPGTALDGGTYELYVVAELLQGDPEARAWTDSTTVVGGPVPVTLEAPFDPHPALADLVVGTAGLGPLTVGLPPETNPGAAMIRYVPDACVADRAGGADGGDPGRWLADYDPVPEFAVYGGDELQPPFTVAVADGVVARVDVRTDRLATAAGIRLGSTLAELRAAYPGIVEETSMAGWSRVWVVRDAAGTLVVETADDLDGYLPELTEETVVGIRVLAPGAPGAAAHTLGSDDVAGSCI